MFFNLVGLLCTSKRLEKFSSACHVNIYRLTVNETSQKCRAWIFNCFSGSHVRAQENKRSKLHVARSNSRFNFYKRSLILRKQHTGIKRSFIFTEFVYCSLNCINAFYIICALIIPISFSSFRHLHARYILICICCKKCLTLQITIVFESKFKINLP